MINLNIQTLLIHLVFFLIMLTLLNQILFKPLLKVMDERKDRVAKNRAAADLAEKKAHQMVADFDAKMAEARKDAAKEKETVRRAAETEREKIVKQAREKAGDLIGDLQTRIAAEFKDARATLIAQGSAMGRDIAARVLGRNV